MLVKKQTIHMEQMWQILPSALFVPSSFFSFGRYTSFSNICPPFTLVVQYIITNRWLCLNACSGRKYNYVEATKLPKTNACDLRTSIWCILIFLDDLAQLMMHKVPEKGNVKCHLFCMHKHLNFVSRTKCNQLRFDILAKINSIAAKRRRKVQ